MLKNYFKIAIAVLKRNKFFTFISLFGIACTLMVLMVITAFADHMFGANYPEVRADRCLYVMTLSYTDSKHNNRMNTNASFSFLNKYVKSLKTPEKVCISNLSSTTNAYLKNKKFDFGLMYTDSEFWEIMQFTFLEGKPYTKDQILRSERVVVINESAKKLYFGDESAVGKNILADDVSYKVIGVVKGVPKTRFITRADIYAPYTAPKSGYDSKSTTGSYHAVVLAKNSNDFKAIDDEYQHALISAPMPDNNWNKLSSHADTFLATFTRMGLGGDNNSGVSKVYIGGCLLLFLFFLLPTVNLVNLNISRIIERSSEIGVRKAFGASSGVLIIQFIIENIILTIIGGVIGLLFTWGILQYINMSDLIPNIDLRIDLNVLLYGFALCLIFGIFSGVYPAFKMSKLQIVKSLKSAS